MFGFGPAQPTALTSQQTFVGPQMQWSPAVSHWVNNSLDQSADLCWPSDAMVNSSKPLGQQQYCEIQHYCEVQIYYTHVIISDLCSLNFNTSWNTIM